MIEEVEAARDKALAAEPGKRVLTFFEDEARFGQKGTLTRVWARRGSRPSVPKQTQYDYLYVFGAACPVTGSSGMTSSSHVVWSASSRVISASALLHTPSWLLSSRPDAGFQPSPS